MTAPRSLLLALAAGLALVPLLRGQDRSDRMTEDERLVHAAVEHYVQGFYQADPGRIEQALSPEVRKMGYWRKAPDQPWSDASFMNFEQAKELAAKWNADGKQGKDLPFEITLFEVADKTAAAKVTAKWGQDYFHLVKEGDAWRIHQVLWQSAPAPRTH